MGESQNSSSGNTFSVPTRLGLGFEGVLVSSFEPYFGPSIQEGLGRDKRQETSFGPSIQVGLGRDLFWALDSGRTRKRPLLGPRFRQD